MLRSMLFKIIIPFARAADKLPTFVAPVRYVISYISCALGALKLFSRLALLSSRRICFARETSVIDSRKGKRRGIEMCVFVLLLCGGGNIPFEKICRSA
jgi:hypothetical protein